MGTTKSPRHLNLMLLHTALTLASATIGFVAAVFFCFGAALMTPEDITLQATTFWDGNSAISYALSAQKSQYLVGAFLLVISFAVQILSVAIAKDKLVQLPQWLGLWRFVFLVLALTATVSIPFYYCLDQAIKQQIQIPSTQQ